MTAKTNAMRILERAGIPFKLYEYTYDERTFSAEDAAAQVGMAPETVFKTLLLRGDRSGYWRQATSGSSWSPSATCRG